MKPGHWMTLNNPTWCRLDDMATFESRLKTIDGISNSNNCTK